MQPSSDRYKKARIARDPRFDGKFFVAVITTGIYCRPICPATTPREENVTYFLTAMDAANAGYRPCLRCRPDSAPGSPAWKGVNVTLDRAMKLIDQGTLHDSSIEDLALRLGVSSRYLRQLFKKHLGVSPKAYELYQKCLFAKKLLHQTDLPITQVALASGFKSIRRFNDCFQSQLNLTPSQIRKSGEGTLNNIELQLFYRPPYNWSFVSRFFRARMIPGLEWGDEHSYGRTFEWKGTKGHFTVESISHKNRFQVSIELSDGRNLKAIVNNIRRLLDLDVDIQSVDHNLQQHFGQLKNFKEGLRIPGTWDVFEAGIRAILGQQVSIQAARTHCTNLVHALGETLKGRILFPTPIAIMKSELDCLNIPLARKNTLKSFSQYFVTHQITDQPDQWQQLKGIGPWTTDYAKLRGLSDPDIYLGTDLGIKKAADQIHSSVKADIASPWRSYLTLQLWSQL
ncbi:MAG TPA: transcriptional regulator [Gammaproteobacteria bacterium]|nr:transcriptional regulator [Gammaproteobacteria bacterium]